MSQERLVIRRAAATDLPKVELVASVTWEIAYLGIIPEEVQRRLLEGSTSLNTVVRSDEQRGRAPAMMAR